MQHATQETKQKDTPYFEIIDVEGYSTACDGGKGALGHPLVYLDLHKTGSITCPYCSRHFVHSGKPSVKKTEA